MTKSLLRSTRHVALPTALLLAVACGGTGFDASTGNTAGGGSAGAGVGGLDDGGTVTDAVVHGGATSGGAASASAGAGSSDASANSGGLGSGGDDASSDGGGSGKASSAGSGGSGHAGSAGSSAGSGGSAGAVPYSGPTVGTAKAFAALAYSAITAANISTLSGKIGVSAGAVSTITGFDSPLDKKYGTDSLAPNNNLTALGQEDVTTLVGNIDPRPCDADFTSVPGGLTGDVTLYPGVTCMNSFANDVLLNGHVTLDAGGNPNAFFIIRGNLTLTVADAAQIVLTHGAEACGVFWRISKQVTIGKTVKFYGTVIAGSAITMNTGSTLVGRALAQTAGVHLDANTITIPSDGLVGAPGVCTHVQ